MTPDFPKIEPDRDRTLALYRCISEFRASEPESFGGCGCQECRTAGQKWSAWIPRSFIDFTESLGISWLQPFEVCCAGDLGKEATVVLPDYLGIGRATSGNMVLDWIGVCVSSGNVTPGSWFPPGHPKPADVEMYTVSLSFKVLPNLEPIREQTSKE